MEPNWITGILLPVALGIIMLGLGLSLTLADFKRIVVYPRAVIVGLACQVLILPAVCFLIAEAMALPPELAVGLVILAASPGGPTANLFSHLAKGDVALNVTLTAVNSVLSVFTLPIIVQLGLTHFLAQDRMVPLHIDKLVQVLAIVLVPVAIGMLVRAKRPAVSDRMAKPVKIVSTVFLVLVIAAAVLKEKDNLVEYFRQVGNAALVFNLISLLVGYFVPRLVRLPKPQAIAIGMEIGIHNGTLAMAVAGTVLANMTMTIPAAIYSLIMFFTAAAFGFIVNRTSSGPAMAATAEATTPQNPL